MSDSNLPEQPMDMSGERVREAERERIARDLHDELGSRFTAIKMALAQLAQHLPAHRQEQVRHADGLVDDAIDAMHDIIDDLHPAVLDLGLVAALEWLAKTFTRQTGVAHRLLNKDDLPATLLEPFQAISLYRIAREALHNASRHARARHVSLSLHQAAGTLVMEIVDDGVGLAGREARAESSGIRGMQRRAAAIGASLTLQTTAGGGARLRVALALPSTLTPDL